MFFISAFQIFLWNHFNGKLFLGGDILDFIYFTGWACPDILFKFVALDNFFNKVIMNDFRHCIYLFIRYID